MNGTGSVPGTAFSSEVAAVRVQAKTLDEATGSLVEQRTEQELLSLLDGDSPLRAATANPACAS